MNRGKYVDKAALEETFLERSSYMLERGLHVWVGEFGPVYTGDPVADEVRYQVLHDQLEIYNSYGASWAIWLYKDIGLQGVTYAGPDSPWVRRIQPFLEKKSLLGADSWGSTEHGIRDIMEPIEQCFARDFPDYHPFPFGAKREIQQLVRYILLAEPLVAEFAERFRGVSDDDLDTLMRSFLFDNCAKREKLADSLSHHAVAP